MHALAELLPGAVSSLAAAASIVVGLLLLMLAHGLKRRKRRAWVAAVALLPVGAAAQLLYRHSVIGMVLSLVLMGVLIRYRAEFAALPDPRSRWMALANLVVMGAVSVTLGLLIVRSHPDAIEGSPSLGAQLEHVLWGLFGFEGPVDYRHGADYTVGYSLGALGLLTVATTAYLAFRPEHPAARLTPGDEERLRELLATHGRRDSLGHFALRRDKAVVFSPSGKAAVCYRVVSGVMLASGDPVGDVEAWPGAIACFMEEARAHSWTPAVMGCSETGGEVWTRETGLDALELGDEAIVDVADFTLSGRAMRNVRQMVKRIERAGLPDPGAARRRPGPRGAGGHPARRRRLAGHRHRARLLDGAGPDRRPGGRGRGHRHRPQGRRRGRRGPVRGPQGRAALRAVGPGRDVAGADAA